MLMRSFQTLSSVRLVAKINCEQPNNAESDSEVFSETTGTECEQSSDPDEDPLELARPAKAGRVEQQEETKPMFFKHRTSKLMLESLDVAKHSGL